MQNPCRNSWDYMDGAKGLHINSSVFGKAIHSLSKIGEELYFEPLSQGLALRSVNASRSAYTCFLFAPEFFTSYEDGVSETDSNASEDSEAPIKCKIGVKSCLTVFRSLSTLEKTVDRCQITLNMKEARLVFKLHCRHGIVKTHNLAFIECETLQAIFSKDSTPNKLIAHSRLLCDAVVNFQTNQEEVTLCVSPEKVLLKNYVDDEPDPSKVIRTELGIDPEEFDSYHVEENTEVTFCLKELRAILSFSESANLPVNICFESAGRPIIFTIDSDSTFEVNFVLATLAEAGSSSQTQSQAGTQRNTQTNTSRSQNQSRSIHTTRKPAEIAIRPRSRQVHNGDGDHLQNHMPSTSEERSQQNGNTTNQSVRHDSTIDINDQTPFKTARNSVINSSVNRTLRNNSTVVNTNTTRERPSTTNGASLGASSTVNIRDSVASNGSGDTGSPVIPVQSNLQTTSHPMMDCAGGSDDETASEEDDEDVVPGTPPPKKFKSLFLNLSSQKSSNQSMLRSQPTVQHEVLAPDTDDED